MRIGDFTLFRPAVQIYTPLHPRDAEQRRGNEFAKPVEIGSMCGSSQLKLPFVFADDVVTSN